MPASVGAQPARDAARVSPRACQQFGKVVLDALLLIRMRQARRALTNRLIRRVAEHAIDGRIGVLNHPVRADQRDSFVAIVEKRSRNIEAPRRARGWRFACELGHVAEPLPITNSQPRPVLI